MPDKMTNANFKRELIVGLLCGLVTALIAAIAWGLNDRLHVERYIEKVDNTVTRVDAIENRLQKIPPDPISRAEHLELEKRIDSQHQETLQELRDMRRELERLLPLVKSHGVSGPISAAIPKGAE